MGLALALAGSAAGAAARYGDGPPPGHTGGFGEPSCRRCHFDAGENEPPGTLTLRGVPETCAGGRTYRLAVRLRRPGLALAGFQVAARFEAGPLAGRQAGRWRPLDDRAQVAREDSSGIEYAQHTRAGTDPLTADSTAWTLEWTAPDSGGPVALHAAANAANDDDSELGDRIYTASARACAGS